MKKIVTLLLFAFISAVTFAQNNALHFDGTDDYVEINAPNSFLSGDVFTIELWYKPTAQSGHEQTLISRGSGGNFWEIINNGKWNNASSLVFYHPVAPYVEDFGSYPYDYSILDQWHHVAVTSDGVWIKLYHDGTFIMQDRVHGSLGSVTGPIRLGAPTGYTSNYSPSYDGGYFNGAMDEVRLWNVCRSSEQIQADRNREIAPATEGLLAYYNFNQGRAGNDNRGLNLLTDGSASAVNGTLNNFALNGATSNWVGGFPIAAILPVKLISFSANKKNNATEIRWTTAQEENLRLFEVEKSSDGQGFNKIATVAARGRGKGSSYNCVDNTTTGNIAYYRLRSVDNDGAASFSKIVAVKNEASSSVNVFPNPVHDLATLTLVNVSPGTYHLSLYSVSGNAVLQKTIAVTTSNQQAEFSVQNLAAGTYVICLEGNSKNLLRSTVQKQ